MYTADIKIFSSNWWELYTQIRLPEKKKKKNEILEKYEIMKFAALHQWRQATQSAITYIIHNT